MAFQLSPNLEAVFLLQCCWCMVIVIMSEGGMKGTKVR